MLVISRGINQTIFIGHDIRIVVVSLKSNKVQIGIEAPEALKITRDNPPAGPRPAPTFTPKS